MGRLGLEPGTNALTTMNPSIHFKTTILSFFISLALACFGLSPKTQATDLGSVLPGDNTADGAGVLINLTTGDDNSGFGFQAVYMNTDGVENTANGSFALYSDNGGSFNTATGFFALLQESVADGLISVPLKRGKISRSSRRCSSNNSNASLSSCWERAL